jgi:hypothetical protein
MSPSWRQQAARGDQSSRAAMQSVHRIICKKTREITRLRGRLRKLNASAWPKGTAIARVVRLIPFSRTALMSG